MSRSYRTTVRGAGDDVRYALRALRAARTHLVSAYYSHPFPKELEAKMRRLLQADRGELSLENLAVELDLIDARRRRERRRPPQRKAA